ncbi:MULTISPECIES: MFS transporter [unclassified Phycicoccus]|uniref:MFS transporter n=1 Tax=unclassified Phycicoccus TaxID=2637926 RepID=UPI000A6E5D46|nr:MULTISPECIES: MFS transporter [unclassified Phycicoccus]
MTARRHHLPPLWLMALGLVAVAVNLRTAMASVPPVVASIGTDLGLSNAALGALTTLPVLCMGAFAPMAQRVAARIGAAGAIELSVVCVAVGLALRFGGGHVWLLYAATFVAGVGIAIGGTLLPGLVKELFPPERAGLVTGLYMLAMMGGAGASSALSVPLQGWLGSWQASLGSWSLLGLVGALAWIPVWRGHTRHRAANPVVVTPARLPWKHPTAWLVAAYLAVQSIEFYSSLAWIAPTYASRGWDPTHAGYLLSAFTAAQLVSGLLAPALTDKVHDRRVLLVSFSVLGLLGQAGLWLAPGALPWVWAVVLGLGQGAAFALGLVLMVDYAATPAASARLAGMAFLFSYGLASLGPATMGAIRDATGGFDGVWMSLTLLMFAQVALAFALRPGLRRVD